MPVFQSTLGTLHLVWWPVNLTTYDHCFIVDEMVLLINYVPQDLMLPAMVWLTMFHSPMHDSSRNLAKSSSILTSVRKDRPPIRTLCKTNQKAVCRTNAWSCQSGTCSSTNILVQRTNKIHMFSAYILCYVQPSMCGLEHRHSPVTFWKSLLSERVCSQRCSQGFQAYDCCSWRDWNKAWSVPEW